MTTTTRALLPGSDFTVPPEPKEQAIALVFGRPGSSKTSFALRGGPEPMAFFDVDQRGRHALKYATKILKKKILYVSIDYPKHIVRLDEATAKKRGQDSWDRFARNYEIAIKEAEKGNIRTLVIDTATELGEILKISVQGRADKKIDDYGRSKGVINTQMATTIKMVRNTPANLILLARGKEIWENTQPTGMWRHEGLECLEYDADWAGHVRLKKMKSVKKRRSEEAKEFELEITKAGIDISVLGNVYDESDWGEIGPFVWACMENYPGTGPGDWE